MEATEKTGLTEEKETLFITLHAKAVDYRSERSMLNDRSAYELMTGMKRTNVS